MVTQRCQSKLGRAFLAFDFFDKHFNLLNQRWQVGLSETHLWRRNVMVFDVGRDMLVMGMRALQLLIARVRLRIIPVQLFFTLPHFVAILINNGRQTMIQNTFADDQMNIVAKAQLTGYSRK